ncbi:putative F-box/kelch-repeat protein At3g17540 [Raphanus sativus]|uniref:F-box/kelch-repeat protein At3g17540 n=1 Tax=Raphanus sativus TaxID=3726 RepID=A0A6J0NTK6_RAPSA|nr:putative F-box/kelch-repeat protein At3g17540 [Raphanus sativus]
MMMISNLPHDLESEILSRVPAKSLWELRATCKRWYALFRDPRFVEKNKRLGKAVRASILLSNQDLYLMNKDLHNSSVVEELTFKLRSLKGAKGSKDLKFSWIYHCDGLILFQIKEISRLVVWNPCTGQTRFIKPVTRYRASRDDTFSLGYSTSSSSSGHSYKILRYYRYYKNDQLFAECEIYELSSDSWKVLDSFALDHKLCFGGISLNGDTYWIADGKENGYFLMKFDFTAETFVRLPLPFQNLDCEDKVALSVVKDEKLSVLHRYVLGGSTTVMRIWVSNNVFEEANDLSWMSHFVLKVDCDEFDIPSVVNVASFLLDEENKVAICCDMDSVKLYEYKTRIYIVGDGMSKQVYNGTVELSRCTWPCVISYVPSLVHIQKCTRKRGKKERFALK